MYLCYIDYNAYMETYQGAALVFLHGPDDIGTWAKRAGFTERVGLLRWRKNLVERMVLAICKDSYSACQITRRADFIARMGKHEFLFDLVKDAELDMRRFILRAHHRVKAIG